MKLADLLQRDFSLTCLAGLVVQVAAFGNGGHGWFIGGLLGHLGYQAPGFFFDADGGFFDIRCAEGTQVIGSLEAFVPGGPIHVREGF